MRYYLDQIKDKFFSIEWYEVYDFIEFVIFKAKDSNFREDFCKKLNKIFKEEKVPCQIINNLVTPLVSEIEAKEVELALNVADLYQPVRNHLEKALKHYSKRPQADYLNSIKESISALESLARIILEDPKATLGDLTKKLSVRSAFQQGISKLYGWTSDEGGIRHSETKEKISSGEEEARLMLVLSSAFVNYIISKQKNVKT